MSASTGEKVLAVHVFALIGFPAGLCSLIVTPFIPGVFIVGNRAERMFNGILLTIPWLIGLAIAFFLLRWMLRVLAR